MIYFYYIIKKSYCTGIQEKENHLKIILDTRKEICLDKNVCKPYTFSGVVLVSTGVVQLWKPLAAPDRLKTGTININAEDNLAIAA